MAKRSQIRKNEGTGWILAGLLVAGAVGAYVYLDKKKSDAKGTGSSSAPPGGRPPGVTTPTDFSNSASQSPSIYYWNGRR